MMMIYGMFVFMLETIPYQNLQRSMSWRYAKNDRVGRSASWQYIGAGEDKITLNGVLLPEVTGGDISLELLRTAAYRGRPYPLIEGTGMIYGMYIMDGLNEGRAEFFSDGKARRIEFSISLVKASEDLRERLAEMEFSDLMDMLPVKL